MKVSIIVVCYQEENNIQECLESILSQNFEDVFELLVIDNNSTDKTQVIVKDFCKRNNNIKLIINKTIGISGSRNLGVKNAKYNLVAFTDADCVVPKDWLYNLTKGFKKYNTIDEKVIAVGGSNIPPKNKSDFYDTLGIMLNSFIGSRGSVQGMIFQKDKEVEHLPCVNVLYQKNVIIDIGGFDESLKNISEDQDLTIRLRKKGFKFFYLRDTAVIHKLRHNIKLWSKNMFTYGMGRVIIIKKHPQTFNILFLLPVLFVIFLICTMFVIINIYFICVPIIIIGTIFLMSLALTIKVQKIKLTWMLTELFFVTYFFYGIGEICGIFKQYKKQ